MFAFQLNVQGITAAWPATGHVISSGIYRSYIKLVTLLQKAISSFLFLYLVSELRVLNWEPSKVCEVGGVKGTPVTAIMGMYVLEMLLALLFFIGGGQGKERNRFSYGPNIISTWWTPLRKSCKFPLFFFPLKLSEFAVSLSELPQ